MTDRTRARVKKFFRLRRHYRQNGWATALVDARLRAELAR